MTILQVSKGYQISVPSRIRKKYHITIGSKLEIEEKGNEIILRPLLKSELKKLFEQADKMKKYQETADEIDASTEKVLFG